MKRIIGILIFLITIAVFGEDFEIDQPVLEEMSTMNVKNEIKNNEIIIGMADEILKLRTENVMIQKRMDVMDKVIQDKNQLADELNNKVEILTLKIQEIEKKNEIGNKNVADVLKENILKIAIASALLILLLFMIVIGIIFAQNGKNRKMIEDWKDLNDMNRDEKGRGDFRNFADKNRKKDLDDELDFS